MIPEEHLEGHSQEDVKTGLKVMHSPVTDNVYVVRKWIEKEDGKAVALEKELLSEGDGGNGRERDTETEADR